MNKKHLLILLLVIFLGATYCLLSIIMMGGGVALIILEIHLSITILGGILILIGFCMGLISIGGVIAIVTQIRVQVE